MHAVPFTSVGECMHSVLFTCTDFPRSIVYYNIKLAEYSCDGLFNFYCIYYLFIPPVYLTRFGVARLTLWSIAQNGRPTRHLRAPNRTMRGLDPRTPAGFFFARGLEIKLDLSQQLSRFFDIVGFIPVSTLATSKQKCKLWGSVQCIAYTLN